MPDLRTLWPSLSAEQKNALVAMGMGWKLYQVPEEWLREEVAGA